MKNGGLQNGGDLTQLLTRPKEVRLTSSNQTRSADVTTKIIALANYAVDANFATLSNDTNSIISQKERLETEIKSAETRNRQLGPEISCSESMVSSTGPLRYKPATDYFPGMNRTQTFVPHLCVP